MSGGFILVISIAVFVVLLSSTARKLVALVVFIVVLIAAANVFIHSRSCPNDGTECFVELQPVWSGACTAGDRAGILKIEGVYYLTAEAGAAAKATCLDLRFWNTP